MTGSELNVVRDLNKKIYDCRCQLETLRISAENLVPIIDGLPHAKQAKSRVEKIVLMIAENESELETLKAQIIQAKSDLADKITCNVGTPTLQTLLILRYVECLSFKETARRMKSSLRHVYRLHENFLKNVTALHSCGKMQS